MSDQRMEEKRDSKETAKSKNALSEKDLEKVTGGINPQPLPPEHREEKPGPDPAY